MRKMDNTNFDASNIEYVQFWMLSPFLDPDNNNPRAVTCISTSAKYPKTY